MPSRARGRGDVTGCCRRRAGEHACARLHRRADRRPPDRRARASAAAKLAGALDALASTYTIAAASTWAHRRVHRLPAAAGAAYVTAVGVGRGQLAWSLRQDLKCHRHGANERARLGPGVGSPPDLCVGDLSFISLRTVAPSLLAIPTSMPTSWPQAAVRGGQARRPGGIVRDPVVHARAARRSWARRSRARRPCGRCVAVARARNVEFLAYAAAGDGHAGRARRGGPPAQEAVIAAVGLVPHRSAPRRRSQRTGVVREVPCARKTTASSGLGNTGALRRSPMVSTSCCRSAATARCSIRCSWPTRRRCRSSGTPGAWAT